MRTPIVGFVLAFCCMSIGTKADAHWQLFSHADDDFQQPQSYFGEQADLNRANIPAPYMMAQPNLQAAMSAAANPANQAIAQKIFCYCGCDREDGHRNLLDCYRTGHVPNCKTCQNEFVSINQMRAQGESLSEIQNNIDSEFSHVYPYHQPSAILRSYLASKESPGAM